MEFIYKFFESLVDLCTDRKSVLLDDYESYENKDLNQYISYEEQYYSNTYNDNINFEPVQHGLGEVTFVI